MADRYLYMGAKASFTRNVNTVTDITTAGRYDSVYTDTAINVASATAYAICDLTDGNGVEDYADVGETFWFRTDNYYTGGGYTFTLAAFMNNSDQDMLRIRIPSSGVMQLQMNTGTLASPTWTQIGSNIGYTSGNLRTVVFKVTIDAAGTAHAYELFINGVSQASGTFSGALLTQIYAVKLGEANTTANFSEVLCTVGTNLINSHVHCVKASGAGSNAGMTGAHTDVNEAVLSDATAVSSGTAGQKTTFAITDLPALPPGLTVGTEVRHTFRANNDGTSPANLKPVIRQSGADTVGASVTGLGLGYKTFTVKYTLTHSQINTAGFELGWESAA